MPWVVLSPARLLHSDVGWLVPGYDDVGDREYHAAFLQALGDAARAGRLFEVAETPQLWVLTTDASAGAARRPVEPARIDALVQRAREVPRDGWREVHGRWPGR